ncbi:hypothetical protein [Methylacidimicrobium tartarophylax]|uniref:Uncharacterized protein n=1 Tax=Methylacidimicrobium tartarophylax TaxID=1041768 RepID=A0A5E6MJC5_9BACT|nr:hypothetical protein [Methylacidimicrobium tartarophylax]VVM06167.1 hypothetical protein MAMT_01016 [Methylacidimicrobium tartarophylax]
MALNRKLSALVQKRELAKSEATPGQLSLSFTDGSQLLIRLASAAPPMPGKGTMEKVLETGSRLVLVLEPESRIELALADPGASISLRDAQGTVEYLG